MEFLTMRELERITAQKLLFGRAGTIRSTNGVTRLNEGLWHQLRRGKIIQYGRAGGITRNHLKEAAEYVSTRVVLWAFLYHFSPKPQALYQQPPATALPCPPPGHLPNRAGAAAPLLLPVPVPHRDAAHLQGLHEALLAGGAGGQGAMAWGAAGGRWGCCESAGECWGCCRGC